MKTKILYSKSIILLVISISLLSCKKEEIAPPDFALQFDGLNGHVTIENSESLSPSDAISIALWVRLDGPVDCDATDNWVGILNKGWPFETNSGYSISVEVDKALTWSIGTEGGYVIYGTSDQLQINQWTYLTLVYNSSTSQALIYWNGILNTSAGYGDIGQGIINSNFSPIQLNTPSFSTCTEEKGNFPGSIDDLSIWNKVLTPQEIRDIMENSLDGTEAGLISYWPFNEGSELTARDKAGNNDGALLGGVTWIDR